MDDNINFDELWAQQKTGTPDKETLLLKVAKFKKANYRKIILTNLSLMATAIFIVWVWLYFQPQLLTTKIGIVLIIIAILLFLGAYNQSLGLLKNPNTTITNNEYLKNLLALKAKQHFIQTTVLNLYFILLSIGIGLYMYEYARRMPIWGGILTYAITGLWLAFNWFYLRPRFIKKQQDKINEIISKFEAIQKQLDE